MITDSNLKQLEIIGLSSILILEMSRYDEIISKNPLKFVKAPKKEYKEIHIFNKEDMKLLIKKSSGQFKNILMFNFFAGLRGSELIALRWNDIDFDSETIRIDTRSIECDIAVGTMHTIRKSCNTLFKQYGLPLDWILNQLGHMDADVNREHYTGKIQPDLSKVGRVLTELKIG